MESQALSSAVRGVSRRLIPNKISHRPDGVTEIFLERKDGSRLVCIIDTSDYDLVREYRWRAYKGGERGKTYYAATTIPRADGTRYTLRMHSLLLPEAREVDHKLSSGQSCDGLDNRRCNLRAATRSQNNANKSKRRNASSRFLGVTWNKSKGKFQAQIRVARNGIHLGTFDNEFEAARAFDAASRKHFGEFSRLNFPDATVSEQAAA
jgi:hypothetical protein